MLRCCVSVSLFAYMLAVRDMLSRVANNTTGTRETMKPFYFHTQAHTFSTSVFMVMSIARTCWHSHVLHAIGLVVQEDEHCIIVSLSVVVSIASL